jgi:hypothetical protein
MSRGTPVNDVDAISLPLVEEPEDPEIEIVASKKEVNTRLRFFLRIFLLLILLTGGKFVLM